MVGLAADQSSDGEYHILPFLYTGSDTAAKKWNSGAEAGGNLLWVMCCICRRIRTEELRIHT